MNYPLLPPLSAEDYAALKQDIAEHGVQVPIEMDEDGNILDGYHRVRAAEELGISDWPKIIRRFDSDADRRSHARRLNVVRRHLTQEKRRALIADELKEAPARSNRQIAAGLRVDDKTVQAVRAQMEADAEIPQVHRRKTSDGKSRPATQRPSRSKHEHSSHAAEVTALLRAWETARRSAQEEFLKFSRLQRIPAEAAVAEAQGGDVVAYAEQVDPIPRETSANGH